MKHINTKKSNIIAKSSVDKMELYRRLRTRIELSKKQITSISVVSNDVTDGKTEVALFLAESYAKSGKKTLLIDGNLRNPELSTKQKIEVSSGLSHLLKKSESAMDSIIKMNSDNLYLLPTRKAVSDSTELLEGIRLKEIFEEVKVIFDMLIIDTPAMNDGVDAILLSKQCDGTIYLTVENKTKISALKDNKLSVNEAGIYIIGAVYKEKI